MSGWIGWQEDVLRGLGAPVNANTLGVLNAWQACEGGTARFNPLNTTQPASGATDYNSVHVKNYPSQAVGLQATLDTLRNGNYDGIVGGLRDGSLPARVVVAENGNEFSTWGTSISCILSRLGAPAPPPPPPSSRPPTAPTKPPPKHQTPRVQLPAKPGEHVPGSVRTGNVLHNWKYLTDALGRTLPTQDYEARKMIGQFPHSIRWRRAHG
jgi:hypothetical protein